MAHVPHLLMPGPWISDSIGSDEQQRRHLVQVLRLAPGSPVSYTDGAGVMGSGTWTGDVVARGPEVELARRRFVRIACAAPRPKERQRFLVEKLAELGVAELIWIRTEYSEGRPPGPAKSQAWAAAGLEQSRGGYLMGIVGPVPISDVDGWAGQMGADSLVTMLGNSLDPVTFVIGPEGGLSSEEVARCSGIFSVGVTVLRTETAAIVSAGLAMT